MSKLDEIRVRAEAEPDWGVYDGALSRNDLELLLAETERLTTARAARDQRIVDALNLLDELRSEYAMEHDAYSRLWDAIEAIEPEEANPNG